MGTERDDDSGGPGAAHPLGHDLPIPAVLVRDGEDPGQAIDGLFADPVAIPVHTGADGQPGGRSVTGYLAAQRRTSRRTARAGLDNPAPVLKPRPGPQVAPAEIAAWPNGRRPFAPIGRRTRDTP